MRHCNPRICLYLIRCLANHNLPRIRWEFTFAENGSISDLRAAVKAPEGQNPCLNGLRSICWKASSTLKGRVNEFKADSLY